MDKWQLIVGLFTGGGFAGLASVYLTRQKNKSDDSFNMMDRLLKEIDRLDEKIEKQLEEIEKLNTQNTKNKKELLEKELLIESLEQERKTLENKLKILEGGK